MGIIKYLILFKEITITEIFNIAHFMFCFEECEVNLTCFQSESITNGNNLTRLIRKPIPFTVVQNPDFINGVSCLQVIASEFFYEYLVLRTLI